MTLLSTLVQISDIHIGLPDAVTGNATTTADIRRLACTFRLFQGSLGHQFRSLQYLRRHLRGMRQSGESFEVVVTGDFTRCGDRGELMLAFQYLTSKVSLGPSPTLVTGLQLGDLPLGVPGNHDHWGGYNSPASTTSTLFHASPLEPASGFPYVTLGPTLLGRQLVFIGINSDADVPPGSLSRVLAQGRFLSQLKTLGALGKNSTNQLRILVIHHARQATGTLLRMSTVSRAALDAFLKAADIRVVLSGHTHSHHTAPIGNVQELCSPSTSQIDEAPFGWVNIYGNPPTVTFERNGFLIHRLHDDGGDIRWDVHVMTRGPQGRGFEEAALYQFKA